MDNGKWIMENYSYRWLSVTNTFGRNPQFSILNSQFSIKNVHQI